MNISECKACLMIMKGIRLPIFVKHTCALSISLLGGALYEKYKELNKTKE